VFFCFLSVFTVDIQPDSHPIVFVVIIASRVEKKKSFFKVEIT